MTTPTGEQNGNARLTSAQVASAKVMRARGRTFIDIGRDFGVDESTVRRAVEGRSWRAVPEAVDVDHRAVFAGALARMSEAHDALMAEINFTTLIRYETTCAEARRSFEALVLAGVEKAKARWPR